MVYKMAFSNFQNCGFLTPKIKILFFFKNKCPKIPKIIDIQKNGLYVIELCVINRCTQFQANIFIFSCECAMAQKPGQGDDVTCFESHFLALLTIARQNK